ncbi:MAG: hypothetical protein IJD37_06315 [Clostridia bacterium]|nr:hypothetical protein [Clostridia bacterium]
MKNKNRSKCKYCKTGMKTYELDHTSAVCPYLECYENGNCGMYEALDKYKRNHLTHLFKKLLNRFRNIRSDN